MMKKMKRSMYVLFVFVFSLGLLSAAVVAAEKPGGTQGVEPSQGDKIALANALLDNPKTRGLMSAMLETKLLILTGRLGEPERGHIARPQGEVLYSPGADVQVNNSATDTGSSTTQSETTIRVNPNTGTICSAYNDSQHWAVGSIGFSGFSRSIDGGATFIDQGPFPEGGGGNNFGDPSLEWRAADGYFYYAALHTNGLGLWRSTDDCGNFAFYSMIHSGTGDDKELMAVDNNPASPYYGRFYVAWTDFAAGGRIYLTYSDNGSTWSNPVVLTAVGEDVQGAWPAVAPNGDVYVAWVRWNPYYTGPIDIEVTRSTNGGATFTPVTNPLTGAVNPRDNTATANCARPALNANGPDGIRYLPSPQIAVGPDGCLHVVYSYDPDGQGTGDVIDVFYRRSCDYGATWGTEVRLNDDSTTTDQWFPTVSVGPNNVVVATWYDRRNDAANNYLFDYYKVFSYDGGVTWGPNLRVSDVSSEVPILKPNFDPVVVDCYHGDYDQQVQDDEFVYILWSDDRNIQNGHPDPDIWFEKEVVGLDGECIVPCGEDESGSLNIVETSGTSGDEVTVTVEINNAPNAVQSLGFEVKFNPDVCLNYTDVFVRGDLIVDFDFFDCHEATTGVVTCGGFKAQGGIPAAASGSVAELTFLVTTPDLNEAEEAARLDLQNLVDNIAGWPTSPGYICGGCSCDINGDGEITPQDALCAFQKYLGICPTACGPCDAICCDVTLDGDCTPADALEIFREYLGIIPNACSPE